MYGEINENISHTTKPFSCSCFKNFGRQRILFQTLRPTIHIDFIGWVLHFYQKQTKQPNISDLKNLLSLVFPILFSRFRIPVPVSGSDSGFRIPCFRVARLLKNNERRFRQSAAVATMQPQQAKDHSHIFCSSSAYGSQIERNNLNSC